MKRAWSLILTGALAFAGCSADVDSIDIDDGSTDELASDTAALSSADRADIAFRVITDFSAPSSVGSTETRRTFTTAQGFRAYFGQSLPGVDFSREWVTFYSAGVQRTGGYRASVMRVRLDASGYTLKVTTRIESPGEGCFVTQALTRPMVLVAYPIPRPRPIFARYLTDDTTRSCVAEPSCDTVRCSAGNHCELRPVTCVRAPCPPHPTCVPDPVDPCAAVRCAAGTHCEVRPVTCVRAPCPGIATCVADTIDPCARVRCAVGTHCVSSGGSATCELDPGACRADSDCLLYDNYCGGCACDVLGHNQRPVTCPNPVMCVRQPCGGLVARCDTSTGRCQSAPAPTAGVACGRNTCPSGMVCCNASCGICTPPGGACIQLACNDR